MKPYIKSLIATFLLIPVFTGLAEDRKDLPNVIIIFSDDQGYGDLSCHGNPVLKTPNLDKLYDQSIRFDDFHTAPACAPSRGELMTGLYAMRNKVMMVPAGRNLLRLDVPTMPEVLSLIHI